MMDYSNRQYSIFLTLKQQVLFFAINTLGLLLMFICSVVIGALVLSLGYEVSVAIGVVVISILPLSLVFLRASEALNAKVIFTERASETTEVECEKIPEEVFDDRDYTEMVRIYARVLKRIQSKPTRVRPLIANSMIKAVSFESPEYVNVPFGETKAEEKQDRIKIREVVQC